MNRETARSDALAPGAGPSERLLEIDVPTFRACNDRTPFALRHSLKAHPLLSLESLYQLSKRLPDASVKYNAGNLPIGDNLDLAPRTGLSVQETIHRIEECNSWMVLKNIEQDPTYRTLLERCLDEIRPLSEPSDPGMCIRQGFIFISSPGSITPYHLDPEINYLLQIRGRKTIHILDPRDRTVLAEEQLERFFAHSILKAADYDEALRARARVFELGPGDAVHVPVAAPHWVKNGDAVSISFSITFRTRRTERQQLLYMANCALRKRGLSPTPPGQSPLRDRAKFYGYSLLRKAQSLVRKNVTRGRARY